ncbi:dTDP-4-dehydrorhamnose 3,5-epimerase family protein [Neptunicella marina]|uniref:dTDP-4-dehydrorhamnose 3,5-epimerase n=1 Tax=Neptunicella marina TaxID=2125989 RepID=A0A8J6LYR8_9ALTE|nr:dTDP-4-dehydrorhamnose 3,5-epimerase family protein [Neptunicella marina]MBC3765575.1 dTDP-4-dehydrorhamnose 3,5-epimerase family protein [Neptunicella marina]
MKIIPTALAGAVEIQIDPISDERGFFARTWCSQTFQQHGLPSEFVQTSVCHNKLAGTLRGMHFQRSPSTEGKLIRCEHGKVLDVVIDCRPSSNTFCQHISIELDSQQFNALYVPPGFAHGYQTLTDNAVMHYMMTDVFSPELAGGFRYNDPAFAINWPLPVSQIAGRDSQYADFDAVLCQQLFNEEN